jgi:aspartyl-tRNA(Asn)/glutamyl-tRNA(Gln) amidotransferase subunit A
LQNVFPLAWSLDHVGVFARSVEDLGIMLDALAESQIRRPAPRSGYRIGVVREFFYDRATPEARALNDRLAALLSESGFRVSEVRLPEIFGLHQSILRTILRAETACVHERIFAEHGETYGPKLRALIETGMLIETRDYMRARRLRRRYQREMARLFQNLDVLITPPARGAAPEGISTTGDPVMNGPWTLADFPTMTLPLAFNSAGLPIGVQLTGPPLLEGFLLQVAGAMERLIGRCGL